MGFTPRKASLRIVFEEDTPLHGLEIRARPCSIGEWNEMLVQAEKDEGNKGVAAASANDEFAQWFMGHVESWNLELDEPGVPSPINLDTWHKLDFGWNHLIIAGWQFAMVSVPKLSKTNSPSGAISAEQQLGLESTLASLPNWEGQN